MHIDHIGIAVKDLEQAIDSYQKILNQPYLKRELVKEQNVETVFFQTGESKVELLGATSPDSVIASYINKKGEGLHHVAFEVDNIETEIIRLKQEGFFVLSDTPQQGADNKRIVFLHPKDCNGVLVELCQTTEIA